MDSKTWESGRKVMIVPVPSAGPTTSKSVDFFPRSKRIRCSRPSRFTRTSSHSLRPLTTESPTPCKPPDTRYIFRSNLPPLCIRDSTISTPGAPYFGWMSTGIPRPSSATVTDPSAFRVTWISLQKPAIASSIELSTTSWTRWRSLLSLPPDPVAGILQDDADRREGVANSVRGREIFPLAGVLSECNDQVEETFYEVRAPRGGLEDAQHVSERPIRSSSVVEGAAPHTRFEGLVHHASVLEDHCDGLPGVEVVRHRRIEIRESLRRRHHQRVIRFPGVGRPATFRLDRARRLPKPLVRSLRLLEELRREVDWPTVLDVDQEEADHFGLVELQRRFHRPVIAEGLVHLLPFHGDHAAVNPVFDEGRDSRVRFGLGDFRLVVREH